MTATNGISPRQLQIYETIRCFQGENGYSPTVREIQRVCDISSTSLVHFHLTVLRKRGLVTWQTNRLRTLRVVRRLVTE